MDGEAISRDFTVLDGGAFVIGAAVAAAHLRLAFPAPRGGAAWCFVGAVFLWLAVTTAGPFVYLTRRLPRRPGWTPRVGDRLWLLWGLPWIGPGVVAALRRPGGAPPADRLDPIYVGALGIGLFLATAVAVPVLATRLLWGEPGRGGRAGGPSWTQGVGLALSAAWPIQVGVGLLVIG